MTLSQGIALVIWVAIVFAVACLFIWGAWSILRIQLSRFTQWQERERMKARGEL